MKPLAKDTTTYQKARETLNKFTIFFKNPLVSTRIFYNFSCFLFFLIDKNTVIIVVNYIFIFLLGTC